MESQISHTLADLLAYSLKTLENLLHLRLLFKNNFNIILLFLNNINKKEVLTLNKEPLNFNLFTYNQPQFDSSFNLNHVDNFIKYKF